MVDVKPNTSEKPVIPDVSVEVSQSEKTEQVRSVEALTKPELVKDQLTPEDIEARLAAAGDQIVDEEIRDAARASIAPGQPVITADPKGALNALFEGKKSPFGTMEGVYEEVDKHRAANANPNLN